MNPVNTNFNQSHSSYSSYSPDDYSYSDEFNFYDSSSSADEELLNEYEALASSLQHLYGQGITLSDQPFHSIPDVEMCLMMIENADVFPAIGTSGVGPCIAYCGRSSTIEGKTFLGLCHGCATDAELILQTFQNEFEKRGCLPWRTEIYTVGGVLPYEELKNGSLEYEVDILKFAQNESFPIKGVVFNTVEGEESALSVVITKDGVFYSEEILIKSSLKGFEGSTITNDGYLQD